MKASKSDEVGVVFDRDEERREMPPITVISTISLEVITGHTVEPTYHHHFGIHKFIFVFPNKDDNRRDSTGRKVIEVTKEFHEISISDTETESELNTTNEEAGEETVRRGEKEKVKEEEDGEETDAAPTRQMVMPKVAMPSGCCYCAVPSLFNLHCPIPKYRLVTPTLSASQCSESA